MKSRSAEETTFRNAASLARGNHQSVVWWRSSGAVRKIAAAPELTTQAARLTFTDLAAVELIA